MNLLPLLLPGTSVSPNKDIYQFGNTLKKAQFAVIESCETDNFYQVKDKHGHKFTISLTEIGWYKIKNNNENRPRVDMEIYLPGQVLISKHGKKFVFIEKNKECKEFPYRLASMEDFLKNGHKFFNSTRTVEGWTFRNTPKNDDHDIVEIRNERVFTFEQVKDILKKYGNFIVYDNKLLSYKDSNDNFIILSEYDDSNDEIIIQITKENNSVFKFADSYFHYILEFKSNPINQRIIEKRFQILTVETNF